MGYQSRIRHYYLDELDIPSTAGASPFISQNSVARAPGLQKLSGASAAPATIWMNDDYPWTFADVLKVEFVAKLPAALGAGDELFLGLAGAEAVIGSLAQGIGFHFDATSEARAAIIDTTAVTEEQTGLTVVDTWRRFVIDLYTGVQSVSPPGVSVGGLGNIQFSIENDDGQLVPVGGNTLFDMSAYAASGCQLLFTAESTGAAVVDLKYANVEFRDLP
jgi:hypothetical protein